MEMLRFILDNVLGPVFDRDLAMVRHSQLEDTDHHHGHDGGFSSSEQEGASENDEVRETDMKWQDQRQRTQQKHYNSGDAILDPRGPKLYDGARTWILFYQLIGHMNLPRTPLYLALAYKLVVISHAHYIMQTHFALKLLRSQVLGLGHANPIFVLISFLTMAVSAINTLSIFYTNTFNLCPLFKILNTPRLCYVNRRTQNAFGEHTLKWMLMFYVYHSLCFRMLVHETFERFLNQFNLFDFLLEVYAITVQAYNTVGLTHLDFYVRSCFAAWLLALKTNLECRRARVCHLQERQQQQQQHQRDHAHSTSATPIGTAQAQQTTVIGGSARTSHLFISLDEIQKSLNTMDDHLEVTRSIQTFSILLISLQAFLVSGALFLIAYNMLAKANNYYLGLLFILAALNHAFLIMLTYLGDSFVYYALGKLVQTVEDEYFQQDSAGELDESTEQVVAKSEINFNQNQNKDEYSISDLAVSVTSNGKTATAIDQVPDKQSLRIQRSDVLFYRELLVQFENHLATPWSKLTFKSHLNIMATFATLVAAQIIFDSH